MAPNFLSSITGSLPNPMNMFNMDDSETQNQQRAEQQQQQQQQQPQAGPSTPKPGALTNAPRVPSAAGTLAADTNPGPVARLSSILARGFDALSTPGTPATPTSADPDNTPRSVLTNGAPSSGESSTPMRKTGSAVVIAEEPDDSPRGQQDRINGRSRGLSTATATTNNSGEVRSRRRRVETYVLVKPPPTSAKNPLNLQVQLVVPARSGRPRPGSDPTKANAEVTTPPTPSKSTSTDSADTKTSYESTPVTSPAGSPPKKSEPLPAVEPEVADKETKLARRSSIGSNRSVESASVISSASAGSGGSKQRIIPLYNLAVHNVVQPTTVTDAGTDSKVAKFLKRSLDITGVGILEPMEVWLPLNSSNGTDSSPRPSFDATSTSSRRPVSMISNMSLLSPSPSRVDESMRSSMDSRPANLPRGEGEDGAKKFFGKIFRKRTSAEHGSERRGLGRIAPSKSSHFLAVEAGQSNGQLQVPSVTSPLSPAVHFSGTDREVLAHPTFGLAPSVLQRRASQAQLNPNGAIVGLVSEIPTSLEEEELSLARSARPIGYTWTVRKWAKKNTEGWAAHIVAAAAGGLDFVAGSLPGDGADEVVFEWVKMRVTPRSESGVQALRRHPASDGMDVAAKARLTRPIKPSKKSTPAQSREASPHGSRTSLPLRSKRGSRAANLAVDPGATLAAETDGKPLSRGPSSRPPPTRRGSQHTTRSDESISSRHTDDSDRRTTHSAEDKLSAAIEAGYDSDPEDSETPWSCSVWIKRTGQQQLLATLTPAPHHPKVVGVLKIPIGIKSLTLADLPDPPAGKELASRVREEVCLTEENIKDVVNVTAMWLVAREEFSGFGRKEKRERRRV